MHVTPLPAAATLPLVFDPVLIKRLTQAGPRYSSYPGADHFATTFGYRDYLKAVADLRTRGIARPLSLYLHIPFCDSVCYYCNCNKIVTKNRDQASIYLSYLKREIEMQGRLFAGMNQIEQLHFGGGTPTYLSDEQMDGLMLHLRRNFRFAADEVGEYSIEVDPRGLTRERVLSLRRQGFNRISLGLQDYDAEVQKAVNRVQPEHATQAIIDAAREANFRSVSIDLIYGLPKQTLASMAQTLAKVIKAVPDRIAISNYAHLPHLFKPQRRINEAELPSADMRLAMLGLCISTLGEAGYVYIGMGDFARPGDDLAIAQAQGRLHRNFQGYSSHADMDLVACGISAISSVAATYSQNVKTLDAYYDLLDRNELPIERGICLDMDDALRRAIIQMLMCQFELSIPAIEQAYPISFAEYFAPELLKLAALEADGVVTLDAEWLSVTPNGRFLIGNVCMAFDRYLGAATGAARCARTI
ncbi:MAG: oxygen-independent coproporphyrinogen III oxidase [Massilia sp.]|nr:oxygen-independent coproporphyrinogen III oxidase [Massilia sp.]